MPESFEDKRLSELSGVLCEECGRHAARGTGRALKNALLRRWFVEYLCRHCGERFYSWRPEADPVVRSILNESAPE